MELLLGAVAGALAQIFTIPVSVIATRQQVGHSKARDKQIAPASPSEVSPSKPSYSEVADPRKATSEATVAADDNSFLAVGRQIIREEGVTGLWLGLKPSLVLTVNPAITYGMFERVKSLVLLAKEKSGGGLKLTPWQAFFIGALSKSLATIVCHFLWTSNQTSYSYITCNQVTYPYIMAKVKIQAGTADSSLPVPASSTRKPKQDGAVTLLTNILKTQGFLGWYKVCIINCFFSLYQILILRNIGYGSSDYKSSLISSAALRFKRPV